MTECNSCGLCCDPVTLPLPPHKVNDPIAVEVYGTETAAWIREHLTPILPRKEGLRKVLPWSDGLSEFVMGGRYELAVAWYYSCDRYDPVSKRCTAWEDRPDICRGYPWFGGEPDTNKMLPPTCSYRADIGLPVEVEIIPGRRYRDRPPGTPRFKPVR